MTKQSAPTLVSAILSLGLAGAMFAQQPADQPLRGQALANRMVVGMAQLEDPINGSKLKPGATVTLRLDAKVQLDNGPELPAGTKVIGTVVADDLNLDGDAKLSLRFTDAKLKNGTTVPVKATIVGTFNAAADGSGDAAGAGLPTTWNHQVLAVDQQDAISNVDLHSRIAGRNSGTFVATKNGAVKLPMGLEFELALAPRDGK